MTHRRAHPDHGSGAGEDTLANRLAAPVGQRKLHLGHFAFMRALVQGVDTRASWNRYLRIEGEHSDKVTVRKTVAWLRDEFAAAARRQQRHGAARLVLVDIPAAAKHAPSLPSLADFIAERGLDDFSQAEQLAAYHVEHGDATGRGSRRARLIARQLEMLRWLESLVAEPPRAGDAVSAWLHPVLAGRLEKAGITTLALLIERINGLGSGWYRALPAIGATKAARLVDWLSVHETTIGKAIGTHAAIPRARLSPARLEAIVLPATGIVPLEKLIVPACLSGADGVYRLPQQRCLISASNDHEAILAWIAARPPSSAARSLVHETFSGMEAAPVEGAAVLSHTQRAYLKEAERFFLWAIVQRQKPLSSMTLEDCIAYRDFLTDPQPAASWCGPRGRPRWSPLWRPFEGPLSATAQRRAIAILKSLYRFLVERYYLRENPLARMALAAQAQANESTRSLSPVQWAFVLAEVNALPQTSANRRLRLVLMLLHETGMRISEAVSVRLADLTCRPARKSASDAAQAWTLSIKGSNGIERHLAVSSTVRTEIQSYLASRGLPEILSAAPREAFLLGRAVDVNQRAAWSPAARTPVDRLAGISTATLHDQIKRFFSECARKLVAADPEGAQALLKASAHWVRHAHGFHALATGLSLKALQQNLGHASIASAARYRAGDKRRRPEERRTLPGMSEPTDSKAEAE